MPDSSNRTRRKKKKEQKVWEISSPFVNRNRNSVVGGPKRYQPMTRHVLIYILIDESEIHLDTHRTLSSRTKTTYLFCLHRTTQEPKQAR